MRLTKRMGHGIDLNVSESHVSKSRPFDKLRAGYGAPNVSGKSGTRRRGKLSAHRKRRTTWSCRVKLARLAGGERGESLNAADGYRRHAAGACRAGAEEVDCPRDCGSRTRRSADGAVRGAGAGDAAARADGGETAAKAILAELAACGGELPLSELRARDLPSSTLQTLVKRGLVRIEERAAAFRLGGILPAAQPIHLNEPQTEALASIATALGSFQPFLLPGVTGSGKTAVYLAAMQRALDRGMASILLVPEIGLTPQTAGLLDQAFGQRVALLHSALTPEERSEQWRRIRSGDAPIVVGTRSAIFAPAPNLGLILVDEEHDQSYKQEETPRYNARDVAVMRAKLAGAVVVVGSATPSLETWQNSVQARYTRIEMRDRVMNRPLPEVELIDMRREFQQTGQDQLFSRALVEQTQQALDRGEQALILLNRRGYSFAVICRACGEKLECQNCAISLTHHKPMRRRMRVKLKQANASNATTAASNAPCLRAARSARASTSTTWAPARSRVRSGWARYFPARASGAWIGTRCVGGTIWNGYWRGSIQARSICWWARR